MQCPKCDDELRWNSDQQEENDFWSNYSCENCESEYEYRLIEGTISEVM